MNESDKPCPCGSTNITAVLSLDDDMHFIEKVRCKDCSFSALLEDWNTRAPAYGWISVADELPNKLEQEVFEVKGRAIWDKEKQEWVRMFADGWRPLPPEADG